MIYSHYSLKHSLDSDSLENTYKIVNESLIYPITTITAATEFIPPSYDEFN